MTPYLQFNFMSPDIKITIINDGKKPRWLKNKERKERQRINRNMSRTEYCDQCGGQQSWCSCCEMFTRNCCIQYGTCMCS